MLGYRMFQPHQYRSVQPGIEKLEGGANRPRHRHLEGYATVVLAGSLTEASFSGRARAQAGDVLLHGRFDCHMDIDHGRGKIQILRLPWLNDAMEGHFRIHDPDALVRIAEQDPLEAMRHLAANLQPPNGSSGHWTDQLAGALAHHSTLSLQEWAERRGIRPDVVSHAFHRDFGVSPKLYRLESRTRRAWHKIIRSDESLTDIALDAGFADLAHMSNSVRAFTGLSPSRWRASGVLKTKSVQALQPLAVENDQPSR
jgi:AraC-like DNA-binding protein